MMRAASQQNVLRGRQQGQNRSASFPAKKAPNRAHGLQVSLFFSIEHPNKSVRQIIDASD
jgi:hypothetical protein